MNWLRRFSFGQRLALLLAAFSLGLLSFGAWTFYAMQRVNVGGPLYRDILVSERLVSDVLPPPLYIIEPYLTCVQLAAVDNHQRGRLLGRLQGLEQAHAESRHQWQQVQLEPELAQVLGQANAAAQAFFDQVDRVFLPALWRNDHQASQRALEQLTALYEEHRRFIDQVVVLAQQQAQANEASALTAVQSASELQVLILIASLGVVIGLAGLIHHSILQPLNQALEIANKVAAGEYAVPPQEPFADEAGTLLKALQEMGSSLSRSVGAIQESRRLAEAASHAKSEFLANMSHEIRTPLNAIIGLSGLALKNSMAPRVQDYVQKIRQSGEHLLGIVNDILDFSKIESGKLEVECVPFSLARVMETVLNQVVQKAELKGLALQCQVDPAIPPALLGDPLRIGQVLINYANNAVKFTKSGSVHLRVALQERSERQVALQFSVVDTGIGLTAEQAARLFTSFEQADTSTTREYGGTGLGLAICKSLAQAMGGTVGVDSVYGQGCSFWFNVRLGLAPEPESPRLQSLPAVQTLQLPQLPKTSAPRHSPVQGEVKALEAQLQGIAGARILLVEDNEINQLVAGELLRGAGLQVEVAENGRVAVDRVAQALAEQRPYDLVLMDMQMPVMDGVTACRLIRQAQGEALPIVAMTANAMQSDRERCLQAGMDDFVTKPIRADILWQVLLNHIEPRPGLGAALAAGAVTATVAPAAVKPAPPPAVPAIVRPAAVAREQDLLQALHGIADLEVSLGLQHTVGNLPFYAGLLSKFLTGHARALVRIRHYLEQADHANAERLAHTLKGVAATLGAKRLSDSAASLERLLSQAADTAPFAPLPPPTPQPVPQAALEQALLEADRCMDSLVAGLQPLAQQLTRATEAAQSERVPDPRLLQTIGLLLTEDDPRATELWEAHAEVLKTLVPGGELLDAAIRDFDFERALELLRPALPHPV